MWTASGPAILSGYVDSILMPGERLVYRARLHWIIYAPGFTALGLELIFIASQPLLPEFGDILYRLVLLCLFAAIAAFARAWIQQATTEIAVTDRRIILKTGLLQRRTIEMHLDKVESVDVRQSLLGRLLDYGTLVVRGTGAGVEPLTNVAAPLKLRSFVTTD